MADIIETARRCWAYIRAYRRSGDPVYLDFIRQRQNVSEDQKERAIAARFLQQIDLEGKVKRDPG